MTPARSALRTDLNITPLIDIVLVLLIVFMVMVPAMGHAHRTLAGATGFQGPVAELPRIAVLGGGLFQWEQEQLDGKALVERLVAALGSRPLADRKVILRIPAEMPLRTASEAMDLVHLAASRIGSAGDVRAILQEAKPLNP